MATSLRDLFDTLPQRGRVVWLGMRPARRQRLLTPPSMDLNSDVGIVGDRYAGRSKKRQVTLIQFEHVKVVAELLGQDRLDYQFLRRIIVVQGINLLALVRQRFSIGEVVLETTGLCHPCSRMEEYLGPGGYNAMRGHGGITAKVITAGRISIDAEVSLTPAS